MALVKAGSLKTTATVLVTSADLTAEVTGILPVTNGGTGQSVYTNGQLLIGNTTGNTLSKATLTAGSGVTITNGNGSITIAATGGSAGNTMTTETPTGTINGSNATFTLSQTPLNNNIILTLNGVRQTPTTDYTLSGTTITFTTAPFTGVTLLCSYLNSFTSAVQTNSSTVLTIPNICTTARIVVADANALTTSTIRAWVVSKTTGGIDELEADPITLNANCTTDGSINFFISCPVFFSGSYNVQYTIG